MAQKLNMKRECFMSIVGFYGNTALVDKKLASQVKHASVTSLIEKGLLFQAVSVAFFDARFRDFDEGQKMLCEHLRVDNFSTLLRRFGVHEDILRNNEAYHITYI